MPLKLYVENVAAGTTEIQLRDLFSVYGNVAAVNIVVDRAHHKQNGFGYVTMVTPEGGRAAILALHGQQVGEHKLTVSEAWPGDVRAGLRRKPRGPSDLSNLAPYSVS